MGVNMELIKLSEIVNNNLYKNIILIGMPGCGKTTIGKLIAEKLSMYFVDVDEYIEKLQSKKISEIFKTGEENFRQLETKAIGEIVKNGNTVISTGGGVVKNSKNIEILHKAGIIVFIDRPIDKIAGDIDLAVRPLLKNDLNNLHELFIERYPLYNRYADYVINNNSDPEETALSIIKLL